MSNNYDILIIGAGLVGASLALVLSSLPLRVAVSEAQAFKSEIDLNQEGRSLALTYGSARILQAMGVWEELQSFVSPIQAVHVSDRGQFGKTRITAKAEKVSALGYVVSAAALGVILNKRLQALAENKNNVTLLNSTQVVELEENKIHIIKALKNSEEIQAKLIIAADGTNSKIREMKNISVQTEDYDQSALVTTISISKPHQQIAYERFLIDGALAILPLDDLRCALIWTGKTAQAQALHALSDSEFLQQAQNNFGYSLGKFLTVGKRHLHVLKKVYAVEQVKSGFVLLGNAAHTLHPIAAQGFNLGLSDVAFLAQIISDALQAHKDFSDLKILKKYAEASAVRQKQILKFTDNLLRIFSHDFLPFNFARSSGLLALDLIPPLKRQLARRLMGISGKLPHLTRGIPL